MHDDNANVGDSHAKDSCQIVTKDGNGEELRISRTWKMLSFISFISIRRNTAYGTFAIPITIGIFTRLAMSHHDNVIIFRIRLACILVEENIHGEA